MEVRLFPDAPATAKAAAQYFTKELHRLQQTEEFIHIAVSGGTTPALFFKELCNHTTIDWEKIHLYWVDERCVPPHHKDSNYLMTRLNLLDAVNLPMENIHRIHGENEPGAEAIRYASEVERFVISQHNLPRFDFILLGIGDDGHTASIFPNQMPLLHTKSITAVAEHPNTGQNRITLTGRVINNAARIIFLVTGSSKASVVKEILGKQADELPYPAAHISPAHGKMIGFLDYPAIGI